MLLGGSKNKGSSFLAAAVSFSITRIVSACMNSPQTLSPTHEGVTDDRTVVMRMTRLSKLLKHSPKNPVHDDPTNLDKKFSACKHAVKARNKLILPMISSRL